MMILVIFLVIGALLVVGFPLLMIYFGIHGEDRALTMHQKTNTDGEAYEPEVPDQESLIEEDYEPNLLDEDSMAEEGWELIHTAEENYQFLCAEVYKSKTENGYRVILSHTDNPPRLEEDYHFDSYEEAIKMADDWGCSDEDD